MKTPWKNGTRALMVTFALTALAAPVALAQEAGGGPGVERSERGGRGHHGHGRGGHGRHHGRFSPEAVEHRLERMRVELSLDEHQVALVREIFAAVRTEASALRDLPRGEARREARRALMEGVATRIDAILTDAQRETFARLRAEHRARREACRGARGAGRAAPEGI